MGATCIVGVYFLVEIPDMQPYEIMTVLIAQCVGAYFRCFKIPAKPERHCQHRSEILCDSMHTAFPP